MLSLPARTATPPVEPPYLFAEPDRVAAWRDRIGRSGFRIGINWQGFSGRFEDKGRSFPLRLFRTAGRRRRPADQPAKGRRRGAASEPRISAVETLDGLDAGPDAFLDTAAVMMNLDLIITSDTSIAHLAGALGRPVWVALRRVPDWRWMLDRRTAPGTRQCGFSARVDEGAWDPVFAAMKAALPR